MSSGASDGRGCDRDGSGSAAVEDEGSKKGNSCCISHHFSLSAAKSPTSIAVIHAAATLPNASPDTSSSRLPVYPGDVSFTYVSISSAVASLSRRIRRLLDQSPPISVSYSTPCIIGVYIAPSVEYIVAVLSVLRSGEAFLPLDPSWPEERILSVVADSRASLVIGRRGAVDGVDWGGCPVVEVSMSDESEDCSGSDMAWPCERGNKRRFCYLMYTSGSTGKPKGVCGTEKGLMNRFWWMQEQFPLYREDVLLFKTSISFVDHLQEFLSAILTCRTLVVPSFVELKTTPLYIVRVLQAYHISRLTAVPSLMREILPSLDSLGRMQIRRRLKVLVLSGEILSVSLWKLLHDTLPETTILNLYGSTEVSGDCTYFNCKSLPKILEVESVSSVPIGIPIPNCEIALIGTSDISDEGEICVSGTCLMTGYFGEPVKDDRCTWHFRTGDFARRLQSGDLIFVGRKDRTVKVNGQRMSLEEIENTLREHSEIRDAAVTFCRPNGGVPHLVAYFTTNENFQNLRIDQQQMIQELIVSIRSLLVRKLPSAMIPSRYFCTEVLPLSASGKIDYTKLPSSTMATQQRSEYEIDHLFDCHLKIIKEAFCSALQVKEISNFDDFFVMGGNSMSAAHAAHKLGIDMRMLYIFPNPFDLLNAIFDQKKLHGVSFVGSRDTGKRLKVLEDPLSLFKASNVIVHDSHLPGGLLMKNTGETVHSHSVIHDANHSMSRLEKTNGSLVSVGSFLLPASNAAISVNSDPWILGFDLPKMCSFSRCNQFMYGGEPSLDYLHEPGLPIEIHRYRNSHLQEMWKVLLKACVDASPLVVLKDGKVSLFIGSHSHIFLCVDAFSGSVLWEVSLEDRIECSAAITGDFDQVVVGCYKGKIYFLDFMTGDITWTFQTNGEVKMQPIVDKLRNLIWCGSHDQFLYALDYKNHCCVSKISCGGSVYGSPCIDMVHNMIFVASTSGHISGISLEKLPFSVLWRYESGAPIFGSLSLDPVNGNVISCLVNGHVLVLNTRGDLVWKAATCAPIFAGACLSSALPSQVLVCVRNGSVYSFDVRCGALLWEYQTGNPITASAYVDTQSYLLVERSHLRDRLACVCTTSGSIHVLRICSNTQEESRKVQKLATMDLPGDVFSSPVMIRGRIFVGCRDDYVYCIDLVT